MSVQPDVTAFWESTSGSVQYIVACPETRACAIIDPVLNYDEKSGATATIDADRILAHIKRHKLTLEWILDTHPHADHLSAAAYLKSRTGKPTAIGARITDVQRLWHTLYDLPASFPTDGRQWDRLFEAGDRFTIGNLEAQVMFSPGHTLCSITYVIGNAAFVHDTLFMPDTGTARADFPGGSPEALWTSIQNILALPENTRLFTGHDYRTGGRPPQWESTLEQQKAENPYLQGDAEFFVTKRRARDMGLPMPRLILHALQVNINAGELPPPNAKGQRFLKLPLNALGPFQETR